jgi:predicted O-methyltransferase YrrM
VPILFERTFEDGNRYGGDITFCRKWRATGGKVFAAYEMRLGHTAKTIITDSLGAALRRQRGSTLRYVADKIRQGSEDIALLSEALRHLGNPYGASEDVLILAVLMARKADGPILEIGSGLSTILMAAAVPEQTVYCIEHDPGWAERLKSMAYSAGTTNIALCTQPIRDGWYDLSDIELPSRFALALVDGPPRNLGSRMPFYERLAGSCETIIADDADDPGYAEAIQTWASQNGRMVDFVDQRAALIRLQDEKEKAA